MQHRDIETDSTIVTGDGLISTNRLILRLKK